MIVQWAGQFTITHLVLIWLMVLVVPGLQAVSLPVGTEPMVDTLANQPLVSTPAGTLLRYGDARVLLPGVNLPKQVVQALSQAAVTTISRRLIHHFLVWTLGGADRFLPTACYQKLVEWYQLKYLDEVLWSWHYLIRLVQSYNLGCHVFQESRQRWLNLSGAKRVGRLPIYPGPALDQQLFMDVVLEPDWQGRGTATVELIPLKTVPLHSGQAATSRQLYLPPWQKQLAELVNTALSNGVNSIRLSYSADASLTLSWHSPGSGWQQRVLQPKRQSDVLSARASLPLLMPTLVSSYTQTQGEVWPLTSMLTPDALGCIGGIIGAENRENSTACLAGQGELIRLNGAHWLFQPSGEQEFLHILNNNSLSPGLPGVMVLGGDISEAEQRAKRSNQYRLPGWLAAVGEWLLYDAARQVMDGTLDIALERAYRWWHNADDFTLVQHLKRPTNNASVSSEVDRVRDSSGKTWIKKVVQWATVSRGSHYSTGFAAQARERQILSELAELDHPNIVRLKQSWLENAGTPHAALVLLEEDAGDSLLKKYRKITQIGDLRRIMGGTLQALDSIHKKGLAHFDIKPENIMEDSLGQIRLGDFGGAVRLGPDGQAPLTTLTYRYAAPEMKVGRKTPWQADIWSLGITGYLKSSQILGSAYVPEVMERQRARAPFDLYHYLPVSVTIGENRSQLADFFARMLVGAPAEREGFTGLLAHPFLAGQQ